ncbi:MAG: hypothetical protein JJ931_06045 [Henriciella sp.]|nr:hypothetical protein [Henriciella sp.]MBO6694959.1 hypothetical protein [Henriciella sp.]
MALIPDGRTALSAILAHESLFPRVNDSDLSGAAIKLARKQIVAAGLTRDDLLKLKETLGEDMFEKTLDSLTPYHVKLLARRLDKTAAEIEVNTGSSALAHVRKVLAGNVVLEASDLAEQPDQPKPAKNKYLGRKAFRTGR